MKEESRKRGQNDMMSSLSFFLGGGRNLFTWLHWVLAATYEIFTCGMWDLVP